MAISYVGVAGFEPALCDMQQRHFTRVRRASIRAESIRV